MSKGLQSDSKLWNNFCVPQRTDLILWHGKYDPVSCQFNGQTQRAGPDSENKLVSVGPGEPEARPQLTQPHNTLLHTALSPVHSHCQLAFLDLFHLSTDCSHHPKTMCSRDFFKFILAAVCPTNEVCINYMYGCKQNLTPSEVIFAFKSFNSTWGVLWCVRTVSQLLRYPGCRPVSDAVADRCVRCTVTR